MKRRALVAGLALMPTAAHAQGKHPVPAVLTPLKEAKTQLVAFDASAFPYRGLVPGTNTPFLDVRDGKRRGHTTLRGDVYWEDPTYSDRRSLLYLPQGFNPLLPSLIVLYLHGQGATLERDVAGRQAIPRQLAASGLNAALVAPQLAFDAADSSAGNFWKPGHFATYIDEAAERLMRLFGDRRVGPRLNAAPVVIVAYSGGYLPAAYALERGGAAHRVRGVILMDALYGDEDKVAAWAAARRRQGFLLSAHTDSTRQENATLRALLDKRRIPYSAGIPKSLVAGTMAFAACGGLDMHVDFMTRAWTTDPLAQALSAIPGYPRVANPGKSR